LNKRVVVTGIGIVSPLGLNVQSFWEGLIQGKSGIGHVTRFNPKDLSSHVAGEVKDFNPKEYIKNTSVRWMDRFTQLGVAAARMAGEDARIFELPDYVDYGVIIGNGAGGLDILMEMGKSFIEEGPAFISPSSALAMGNMASGNIAIELGLQGINYTLNSACASSSHAIGNAFESIRNGLEEVVFAGGTEAPISKMAFGTFGALNALSRRNDSPAEASRPFDANRDGFVLSEGACVVVLEELSHALERGATIYGEICGYGASADAYHITKLHIRGPMAAMEKALQSAGVSPSEIDYINAHGTSTVINDSSETTVIKHVLGEKAYDTPVSSIKSMIGHLLGAAGAMELAACVLSVKNDLIPPTINYVTPDPECDLDYVPNKARRAKVNVAVSNSFAFGGQNAVLVVKKFSR